MNQQDWKNRREALRATIESTITQVCANGGSAGQQTICGMLGKFRDFADKQFDFFYEGFWGDSPYLTTSPAYPAEYALRQTIDQIEFDLSVLRRAHNQRLVGLNTAVEIDALDRADKLTYKAVQPMFTCFYDEQAKKEIRLLKLTTALTYFQKSLSVRVIPYAAVAVIGIPQTCVDFQKNPQDFLAIPHEVGHYVFWHAERNKVSLRLMLHRALPPEPLWRHDWLEEIFADVYGCLVAGPAIVRDFQDMMMDNRDLAEDDGKHPIGALRPYVYTDTLRELTAHFGGDFVVSPDRLDDRWKKMLAARVPVSEFVPQTGDGTAVTVDEARDHIRFAINIILTYLQPVLPAFACDRWTKEEEANTQVEVETGLFDTFKVNVLQTVNEQESVPSLAATQTASGDCQGTVFSSDVQQEEESVESQAYWLDLFQEVLADRGLMLPPSVWTGMLVNGGWAAGGPEGNTNPPG